MISGIVPLLGPLVAIVYRRETEEALRICPGCGAAVRHYDALCMRCGTELEYPDEAELIEPTRRCAYARASDCGAPEGRARRHAILRSAVRRCAADRSDVP